MKRIIINFWLWLTGKRYRYGSIMWHVIHRDKNVAKDAIFHSDDFKNKEIIEKLINEQNKLS